jgi:hypothetical protein
MGSTMLASQTIERARINGQHNECAGTERDKDNVGHGPLLLFTACTLAAHHIRFRLGRSNRDIRKT